MVTVEKLNTKSLKDRTREMVESDVDVARWINNLNSKSAKRIYAEGLLKFSEFINQNPKEIVSSFQNDKLDAQNKLTDFILSLKEKHTPKVCHNYLVSVKSWLKDNDISILRHINCGNIRAAPTIEDEYPPSQEELNRVLKYCDLRCKSAISLMAFAGLRPTTASSIQLKDIPDLSIKGEVKFTKVPAQIRIKSLFSKNSKSYFTFLSTEGCEYVAEYLRYRVKLGEILSPDSFVLTYGNKARLHSFSRTGFSRLIKRAFIRAGYPFRPYILRSYFATAIMNSQISSVVQAFLMGHSGSMESIYTVNKNLPQSQIEEFRHLFQIKVEPKLQTLSVVARNEIDQVKADYEKKIADLQAQLASYGAKQTEVIGFLSQFKNSMNIVSDNAAIDQLPPTKEDKIVQKIADKVEQEVERRRKQR
jgi:integrase